jgi:hypothetical protein
MPIDSRIALGVDPVKVPTVMDLRAQTAQVRNLEAQAPLNQQQAQINAQRLRGGEMELLAEEQKIAATKRKEEGLRLFSKLAAQYGEDHKAIVAGLNQGGYADTAMDYMADQAKIRKDAIDSDLKEVQVAADRNELVANVIGGIDSEEKYDRGIGQLLAAGLPKALLAPYLAKPWNAETQAELKQLALQSKDQRDKAKLIMDQAKAAREEEEFNATKAGKVVGPDGLTPYQRAQIEQGAKTPDQKNFDAAKADPAFAAYQEKQAALKGVRVSNTTNVQAEQRTFSNEDKLRDNFEGLEPVKMYRVISQQVDRARAAFQETQKKGVSLNSADQVLITVLNKILDPQSVVRESEYARTALGQGWATKLDAFLEALKDPRKGGAGISDEERKSVYNMIEKLGNASRAQFDKAAKDTEELATSYGLNPKRVVRNSAPVPAAEGSAPKVGGLFNGQKILKVERVE